MDSKRNKDLFQASEYHHQWPYSTIRLNQIRLTAMKLAAIRIPLGMQ